MDRPGFVKVKVVKDKIAIQGEKGGLTFTAWYLIEPGGEALVEIARGDEVLRRFLWPAYKVWNIAAHADEIAQDMEAGLEAAGASGFHVIRPIEVVEEPS